MKRFLLLITTVMLISQAASYSIYVSPSQRNIQVERGEEVSQRIYLTSETTENITVKPTVSRVDASGLDQMDDVSYFSIDEYSAEDASEWISFSQETYTVTPEPRDSIDSGGTSLEVNGVFEYTIDVPRNAEPGYHVVRIQPSPVSGQGEGASIETIGLSSYSLFIHVPGNAERELTVTDVEALRSGESSAVVRATLENTGTVSVDPRGQMEIVRSGEKIGSLDVQPDVVPPGESVTVETTWSRLNEQIQAGSYRIQGNFDYVTGKAFLQESVSITDFIQIEPSGENRSGGILPDGQGDGGTVPLMLIVMFLVTVGALMYTLEIDPLLIVLALVTIGSSAFVFFSGLPNLYIGGILILALGSFYYGWL